MTFFTKVGLTKKQGSRDQHTQCGSKKCTFVIGQDCINCLIISLCLLFIQFLILSQSTTFGPIVPNFLSCSIPSRYQIVLGLSNDVSELFSTQTLLQFSSLLIQNKSHFVVIVSAQLVLYEVHMCQIGNFVQFSWYICMITLKILRKIT